MEHQKLFDQDSDLYARTRPRYPKDLFKYLACLSDQKNAAWDGACGNGQAAVGLASYFDCVQATDISQGQIENALQHPRVTYSVQPSESTDFHDNQFDIVCIAQALHWFDYDRFWPEVKRVLKPAGIFAAWGYSWFAIEDQIDKTIRQNLLDSLEPYWAPQNRLLWDHYQNVPFPFERIDPPEMGMNMVWDLNQLFGYLRSWSAVRRWIEDQGDTLFWTAYEATKKEWGQVSDRRRVEMDFCLLVGRNNA